MCFLTLHLILVIDVSEYIEWDAFNNHQWKICLNFQKVELIRAPTTTFCEVAHRK